MKTLLFAFIVLSTSTVFGQKVYIENFLSSDCAEEKDLGDSVLYVKQKESLVIIKITAELNCCGSVMPSVVLKKRLFKKNKLNLIYEDYGEDPCNCICYFEYKYTLTGIKKNNYEIYINNKEVKFLDNH